MSPLKKPLYQASTQFAHWRFSPEQLEQTRVSLNAAAVDAIRKTFEADAACTLSLCRCLSLLKQVTLTCVGVLSQAPPKMSHS